MHMMEVLKQDIFDYLKNKTIDVVDKFFRALAKFYPKKYVIIHEEYELKKVSNKYNL